MVPVIQEIPEMQRLADRLRAEGKRIGVVPTMGYLHEGHLSLIRIARQHAGVVITTIFVNPTQFGPTEDFERYPRDLVRDTALTESAGTSYIFAPETKAMFSAEHRTYINVERFDSLLEGKSRPGHFRGVATVVAKLFNITKPNVAVFGQKDAQQIVVIRQIMKDLNFDIDLIVAPTVRENDGLALSSRNSYLSPQQRNEAPVLFRSLKMAEQLIRDGENDSTRIINAMRGLISSQSSGLIDYISIADGRTLEEQETSKGRRPLLISLAVRFGSTRLIDNILLTD
jgi:pantoate--beta-alanine ligase